MDNLKTKTLALLRWSQKYTKTDMVYLASGGFWILSGQIISSILAIILAVAFANLVTPETYGSYKYIISIAGIFSLFALPGLNIAVNRASARDKESVIHTATKERVKTATLGTVVAILCASYYAYSGSTELALGLFLIGAILPFYETFTLYLAYYGGKRRVDMRILYRSIVQIISVASVIGTLFITNQLIYILCAYFVPATIVRIFLYVKTARAISSDSQKKDVDETLTYGKHLSVLAILDRLSLYADHLLIWHFFGPAKLAIYTFAVTIPNQIRAPLLKGVSELAFPKFATYDEKNISKNVHSLTKKLLIYAGALAVVILAYIFAAPVLFEFIFPKYTESVLYSQVFSISLLFSFGIIFEKLFEAQKKTGVQYLTKTVRPIVNIVLLVTLIPFFGIWGAIAARLINRFAMTFIWIILVKKHFRYDC